MEYEKRKQVYQKAITHYGDVAQVLKAVEEMSELIKVLVKDMKMEESKDQLIDELADVSIMCEQLRMIYGVNNEVNVRMNYKLKRLLRRMRS